MIRLAHVAWSKSEVHGDIGQACLRLFMLTRYSLRNACSSRSSASSRFMWSAPPIDRIGWPTHPTVARLHFPRSRDLELNSPAPLPPQPASPGQANCAERDHGPHRDAVWTSPPCQNGNWRPKIAGVDHRAAVILNHRRLTPPEHLHVEDERRSRGIAGGAPPSHRPVGAAPAFVPHLHALHALPSRRSPAPRPGEGERPPGRGCCSNTHRQAAGPRMPRHCAAGSAASLSRQRRYQKPGRGFRHLRGVDKRSGEGVAARVTGDDEWNEDEQTTHASSTGWWEGPSTTRPTRRSALAERTADLNPRPLQPHCSALPDCATSLERGGIQPRVC